MYASKDEARRADEHLLEVRAGELVSYTPHPSWDLDVLPSLETVAVWIGMRWGVAAEQEFRTAFEPRVRRIARNGHRADFGLIHPDGSSSYEEVKGGGPISRDYWLRKWLAEALHGVHIRVIQPAGRGWVDVEETRPETPFQRRARNRAARRGAR